MNYKKSRQAFRPRGMCDHLSPEAVVLSYFYFIEEPFGGESHPPPITSEAFFDHVVLHGHLA